MKKTLSALILISFLTILVLPIGNLAYAQPVEECTIKHTITGIGITCPASGACPYNSMSNDCGICCVMEKTYTITDWIFIIFISLAVIFVLWGGFLLMTAAGNDEKVANGRKWVTWAMIGLIVAFLAKAVPPLVRAIIS